MEADFLDKWLQDPEFREEYARLEPAFQLASCRIRLAMTQRQFAKWIGVSERRIRKLEDGTRQWRG